MASVIPDYESYDYSGVWKGRDVEDRAERELVKRWAMASTAHESALDLGGGFGRITRVLEPRFQRVFMLDYSLSNLRRASSSLRKTTLVRCDLGRLPFEDDTFDFITMVRVMHHITQPDRLLAEVERVARNGGTFVLGIANERLTGNAKTREHSLAWTSVHGHRIYSTPLSRYGSVRLERSEIRGVGLFDNRLGRRLNRFSSLSALDVATARFWPIKGMLFIRFTVEKKEAGGPHEPLVRCDCGGAIPSAEGRCAKCGRAFGAGGIIDLVGGPQERMVVP